MLTKCSARIEAGDGGAGVELEILWLGHRNADIFAHHFRREGAGDGLEGHPVRDFLQQVRGETPETARAVAAHFRLAAIGIVIAEFEIRAFFGGFDRQQTVRADAAVAVAEGFDGFGVEGNREIAIVDDDEVIAGTVHFVEVEEHGNGMDRGGVSTGGIRPCGNALGP